jgi:hypothetical protein
MRVVIYQPNFLPRLKVLQMLAAADKWVVLDNVQYCAREWQNRARITSVHASPNSFWLTMPVVLEDGQRTRICDVRLHEPHLTSTRICCSLLHALRSTPHWACIASFLDASQASFSTSSLTQLCVQTTTCLLNAAGFRPEVVFASSLNSHGKGSELMASLCREIAGDEYVAGSGALNYLQDQDFRDVRILWQHWQEPSEVWPGIKSWRDMSALNYIAREGFSSFQGHLQAISLKKVRP